VIDTHCHLTFPEFAGRLAPVMERAAAEGVTGAVTISTTTRDCLAALAVARSQPRVWCTAGVHPLYADEGPHEWANLGRCIAEAKCVAWGELGLDNHYD
jgi:TatD DNase family protein